MRLKTSAAKKTEATVFDSGRFLVLCCVLAGDKPKGNGVAERETRMEEGGVGSAIQLAAQVADSGRDQIPEAKSPRGRAFAHSLGDLISC